MNNNLYAIDGQTGVLKWAFDFQSFISAPVIGTDGTIYLGSWDCNLHAIDGRTGLEKWSFHTDNAIMTSPLVGADGVVYVTSTDGILYAVDGHTGGELWAFQTFRKLYWEMTMDKTGILYFYDGVQSYAVPTASPGLADSGWPMYGQNAQKTGSVVSVPLTKPRLEFAMVGGSTGNLTLHVQQGGNYQLQYSSTLTDWTNDGPPFLAGSSTVSQAVAIDGGARFWRLVTIP